MDHWSSGGTGSGILDEPAYHCRVLTSTSGNAQSFPSDTDHLDFTRAGCGRAISDSQYVPALPILGSNDKHPVQERLAARKARRSTLPVRERQYLETNKYKNYRGRKRQDVGKDRKPVWPDHIEEAFQNALVHIPALGRKKGTQHGKLHGRNELIAEWILQETGEVRDRKQVSSHIQVLGNLLKDIPQWKSVTVPDNDDDDEGNNKSNRNYYFESIADQVRLQRQLAQSKKNGIDGKSWLSEVAQRHSLSKLTFELWVGAPANITQALHNYTRVPNKSSISPMIPLENFDNWRNIFPDLETVLQTGPDEGIDILLIKSSIALMSDFPPKTSKLGLVLDLDFRSPGHDNIKSLSGLKCWSSVNHMYLHGQPLRKTEHKECQSAEFGLVKPFFEADWWASHFTKLTHKKKEAERNQSEYLIGTVEDHSRSLFRGLSIMQEIFASPVPDLDCTIPRRRMSVLLWVFSQANKGTPGITSWQKVLPPPNRTGSNSPLAPTSAVDSSLPPLVLDSMVESSFDTSMSEADFSHQGVEASMPFSPTIYEPGAYHSGFTPFQNMNNDHLKFYDFTSTGLTPRPGNLLDHKDEMYSFNAPEGLIAPLHQQQHQHRMQQFAGIETRPGNGAINIFTDLPGGNVQGEGSTSSRVFTSPDRRHFLANFDMSTHQMLQAQLGKAEVKAEAEASPDEDYTILEPESQQSVTGQLNDLGLDADEMSQDLIIESAVTYTSPVDGMNHHDTALSHPTVFLSPKLSRPRLMPHNSFAGVMRTTSAPNGDDHEQLGFDTPTRNDFARLMDNHYFSASEDELFRSQGEGTECRASVDGHGLLRPRSQPILPSNTSPVMRQGDVLSLDAEQQSIDIYSDIRDEQE